MRACACSRSRAGPSLAYRGGAKAAARSAWPSRMLAATPRGTAAAIYGAAELVYELLSWFQLTTRASAGDGGVCFRWDADACARSRRRRGARACVKLCGRAATDACTSVPWARTQRPCAPPLTLVCAHAMMRGTSGSVELAAGAGGWGALAGDEGAPGARWPSGVLLPLLSQVRSRPPHVLSRTHTLSAMRARAMPGVSRAWCPALRCRAALPRLAGCAGMLLLPTRRL